MLMVYGLQMLMVYKVDNFFFFSFKDGVLIKNLKAELYSSIYPASS